MASEDYTEAEARAAQEWEGCLCFNETRHLHVIQCMTVDAATDQWKVDAEALRAENAELRKRLNDVLTVCSAMEGYVIGGPLNYRTITRGYRRIRACARGFGDDASKGGRWTGPKGGDDGQ